MVMNLTCNIFYPFTAVVGNVFRHPDDRAITRLSEEFGSYKYIDFEGASSSTSLREMYW